MKTYTVYNNRKEDREEVTSIRELYLLGLKLLERVRGKGLQVGW